MNDVMEQETDVSREIEALRAILDARMPGAPMLSAYLEAALAVLESEGEFPQALSLTSAQGDANEKPPRPEKNKSPESMDSLGGGRIL